MNIALLLEDFCHYSRYIRGVSPNTIKRYKEKVAAFMRLMNVERTEQINEKLMHQYFIKGRVERNWSTATYRTYYMTLIAFFKWCVKHGHLEQTYLENIELPIQEKSLPKHLKKDDALTLLEIAYNYPYTQKYLRYRNHAVFATFLYTGIRKSELIGLKLTDVDLENRSLFVRQGKGNKDRIIPISFTLAQILHRYLAERKKAGKTCAEFFTASNRNSGLTACGLKHLTNLIKEASGVSFTLHRLRHTFATMMMEGGCDLVSLSKMMGHSDIKITMKYIFASARHLRDQITKHPLESRYMQKNNKAFTF